MMQKVKEKKKKKSRWERNWDETILDTYLLIKDNEQSQDRK